MAGLNALQISAFLYVLVAQVFGISLLVRTRGFTDIGWTVATTAILVSSFAALAWLLNNGAKLNILLPLLAATVPLATIMVGVFYYGEPASALKLAMLILACILIGVAAAIG